MPTIWKRVAIWILAIIGAGISIGVAAAVWGQESTNAVPGESIWPLPGLFLLEVAGLGMLGLIAVAVDSQKAASRWGFLTWSVAGALFAAAILSVASVGILLLPAVLAFGGAALLADLWQNRMAITGLGWGVTGGVANFLLLLLLVVIGR